MIAMKTSHPVRLLIAALLVCILGAAAWYLSQTRDGPAPPDYEAGEVREGEITAVVSATGTVNPVDTVQVGSQVSGTIQDLYADYNDTVKKGEVIAQIDPAIFKARLLEASAKLKSAEASRDKAWISVLDTKRDLDRQTELQKKKLVAESVLDAARFAYESATAEHKLQVAAVTEAKAALELERVNLAYTTIYAPIDGVIISRDVDVGQTVAASLQAPTLFTIANDLSRMQVEADVDEAFIGAIEDGQRVSFTVFAYPDRVFHGRVAQVRLEPKVEAGVVKYTCIIRVENSDLALKPGMTATVSIEVAHHEDILKVPNSALRYIPEWSPARLQDLRDRLEPGQAIIWAIEGESLTPLMVRTGIVDETMTEVSGTQLRDGMKIALAGKRVDVERKRKFGLSLF
jgi:HlyD family secretion protein